MSKPSRGMVKANLYLNAQVLEALKRIAALRGCSYAELVRHACREYALREGPKALEQARAVRRLAA